HLTRADVLSDHVDGARQDGRVEDLAGLEQQHELVEEPGHRVGLRPLDGDLVPLDGDVIVGEGVLDLAQQLVSGAQQAGRQVVARHQAFGVGGGVHAMPKCPLRGSPPSTWRCRCGTELRASGPMLKMRRYPRSGPATPASSATARADMSMSASTGPS